MDAHSLLTPSELAHRAGVTISALHFYERQGLISASRTSGNQRRYERQTLRRLALIRIAQRVGVPLAEIGDALRSLPDGRTPTKRDWARLSRRWQDDLDERIRRLSQLRDSFDGCIGCGCLSLTSCRMFNPEDELARRGSGPVKLD